MKILLWTAYAIVVLSLSLLLLYIVVNKTTEEAALTVAQTASPTATPVVTATVEVTVASTTTPTAFLMPTQVVVEQATTGPTPTVAASTATPTSTSTPVPTSTSTPAPTPTSSPSGGALSLYDDSGNGKITCKEARRYNITPVTRDHPAYRYMDDRDGDGVVCE